MKSFFKYVLPNRTRSTFLKKCDAKSESEHQNDERGRHLEACTFDAHSYHDPSVTVIGKALRLMPPTWGDSEVGVHKIQGRQKKVRRERKTQGHMWTNRWKQGG